MTTCSDSLLVSGRYRIVALMLQGEDDLNQSIGYAVLTSAGVRLRHELSLADAKAWLEALIAQEKIRPPVVQPRARSTRTQR